MIRATLLGTAVLLGLSGCARLSESRLNPFNWFGASTETASQMPADTTAQVRRPLVPEGRTTQIVEGRPLMVSITALSIDRTPGGAIVRATAIAPTQGYFNAELVNAGVENGTLVLDFRAQAPAGFEAEGSPRSREITAAYDIDANDLAAITAIRVQGATNARTARR